MKREPVIQIYRDKRGEWRWRLRAANSRIVADGAESYSTHANVRRAAERVRAILEAGHTNVPIVESET